MADASIDQLRISIEAKAASAKSELRGLSRDVGSLKGKVGPAADSLEKMSAALGSVGSKKAAANTLNGVANAVRKLDGVKVSSSLANQMGRISSSISGLGNVSALNTLAKGIGELQGKNVESTLGSRLKRVAEGASTLNEAKIEPSKVHQLASVLNELSNVKSSSISTTINALRRLPEAAQALHSTDFKQVAEDARQLSRALGPLPQKISAIRSSYSGLGSQASRNLKSINSATDDASSHTESFRQRLANLASTITVFSIVRNGMKAIAGSIGSLINEANKYIEDMNLVNVAMGDYAGQAKEYANQVYQALGIAPQDFLRSEGTFTTMARGMGIASGEAATMGQQLTQLSYDLASFYNISSDEAMEKVRSGLAGQIRPLRELGFDLSEAKLKEEAMAMGIDENVESMTQAEKALLRYRAMLNQVSWAQGDMARTLDSPANALRVFQSNVRNAAKSIGTIFLPMIKAIMPAAIAAAKVVATLANMIANLTGGAQIAAVNYGGGTSVGGGGGGDDEGASLPSGGGGSTGGSGGGSNPTAKKYKGIGDAAKQAAKEVKELKRQVLSFDEINKLSDNTSKALGGNGGSGGGSGSGGRGGSGGSGGGSGSGGGDSMPIQTYDFLGNAKGIGDDIFNALMDVAKRAAMALDPLYEAVKQTVDAIGKQFDGLDIAGAMANELVAAVNLFSNFARNVVEILGPIAVAFNFPETAAYAFDLAAQMMNTFSAALNGVGTMIGNFSREAVLPLVAWIGDKLRGAIKVCIDVLSSWQTWFVQNTQALANLGKAAGDGANLVLSFARAVADPLFDTAATAFKGINTGIQNILTTLVNSSAAIAMAHSLGAALAAWALGGALESGLNGISTAFTNLANTIAIHNAKAGQTRGVYDGLRGAVNNLHDSAWLLSQEMGTALAPAMQRVQDYSNKVNEKLSDMAVKFVYTKDGVNGFKNGLSESNSIVERARSYHDKLRSSLDSNVKKLADARVATRNAASTYENLSDSAGVLETAHAKLAVKVASANERIQRGKTEMDAAKLSSSAFATQEDAAAIAAQGVGTSSADAAVKIASGTAAKAAASAASVALSVGERAAAAATGMLSAAMNAIPGMVLATILGELIAHFSDLTNWVRNVANGFQHLVKDVPVLSWIGKLVGAIGNVVGWLGDMWGKLTGTADATGKVTDTTKEANKVLSEEQQRIKDNVDSINEYDKSHNNLRDAIKLSGYSVKDWAKHLENIGTTFDDLKSKQDQFTQNTINSFDKIDTSSQMSLGDMENNLRSNIETQKQWSQDMQQLMHDTGLNSNDALIKALEDGGPEKFSGALHELVTSGSAKEQEFADLGKKGGDVLCASMGQALSGGKTTVKSAGSGLADAAAKGASSESAKAKAKSAGKGVGNSVSSGVSSGKASAKKSGSDVASAAAGGASSSSAKSKAKSSGKKLADSMASGVSSGKSAATRAASSVSSAAATAFGKSSSSANSAGSKLGQSFASGVSSASSRARSAANSVRSSATNALSSGGGTSGARSAGKNLGESFVSGVSSKQGSASRAGRSVARSAKDGISGHSAYGAGQNFGWGYGDGISSTRSYVYTCAWNTAVAAINAVNAAQRSASPSRVMKRSGSWFGQGYGIGIDDTKSFVSKKAAGIADAAIGSVGNMEAAGKRLGSSLGNGFASTFDGSRMADTVSSAIGSTYAAARTAIARRSFSLDTNVTASHAGGPITVDDAAMRAIAEAVERGMLSVSMGGGSGEAGGSETLVLRVDGEELARATARGRDSLRRRGVEIEFD